MKIEYQEAPLDKVIKFYAGGFHFENGETLFSYDSYVDSAKNTVVFRLVLKTKDE